MDFHTVKDLASDVMIISSALHTFLPPYDAEAFIPFPKFQKYYKLIIYLLGYTGVNFRSTVYKSIAVTNNGLNK